MSHGPLQVRTFNVDKTKNMRMLNPEGRSVDLPSGRKGGGVFQAKL